MASAATVAADQARSPLGNDLGELGQDGKQTTGAILAEEEEAPDALGDDDDDEDEDIQASGRRKGRMEHAAANGNEDEDEGEGGGDDLFGDDEEEQDKPAATEWVQSRRRRRDKSLQITGSAHLTTRNLTPETMRGVEIVPSKKRKPTQKPHQLKSTKRP